MSSHSVFQPNSHFAADTVGVDTAVEAPSFESVAGGSVGSGVCC